MREIAFLFRGNDYRGQLAAPPADADCRVLVLTGTGRAFSAGEAGCPRTFPAPMGRQRAMWF